jgi:hypothetical protein
MKAKYQKGLTLVALCLALLPGLGPRARAETEAQRVVARLLAPPTIKTEPGFTAKILVPPGQLYDPLFPFIREGAVWLIDDGGEADGTGGRLLAVSATGKITVIVPYTVSLPLIAGGFAPAGFGNMAGQFVELSQPRAGFDGIFMNHVIQRLDPMKKYAPTLICALPKAGELGNGIAGAGADARFGPLHSAFGGRFFAATLLNGVVYQMNDAGACSAFADVGKYGGPAGLGFSTDGKQMLVTTQANKKGGGLSVSSLKIGGGMVLRISPDGKIDDQPAAKGLDAPMGLDIAPKGFGSYDGQIFVADAGPTFGGPSGIEVPMTQRVAADGKVYRVGPDGRPQLVASGFLNPSGIKFVENKLWVSDIAGDFIGGKRELPDGFIVEIEAK